MAFVQTHNEADPAGTDWIREGDNSIRNYKICLRERLAVDHFFYADETGHTDVGMHKKVTLSELAADPTNVTDFGFVYTKNDGGDTELYYMDAAGNVIQLTKDKYINSALMVLPNDTYLTALDAAGTGTVNLIKAGANDLSTLPDSAEMASDAAPVEDEAIVNKKYVDDQVAAALVTAGGYQAYGDWATKSAETTYLAATDGLVCAVYAGGISNGSCIGYTDSNASPTVARNIGNHSSETADRKKSGICMPVKNGEYWKVTDQNVTYTVYWLPKA